MVTSMFADDTTVYTIGKDTDMMFSSLQCILSRLHIWCTANRLINIAHESKTEAMIISRSSFIGPLPALFQFFFKDLWSLFFFISFFIFFDHPKIL